MTKVEFETVYEKYFKTVYGYVYSLCRDHHIAEEVTQETFYKALASIDGFRGHCKIQVWLCQIAKNTYFTYQKKQKGHVSLEVGEEPADESDWILKVEDKEQAFKIHKLLHDLEEPYKEVFSLRVLGELPFAKIGEIFEKSEAWARVTFYRAKVKLIERLEE